jgi:hypothetical protein
MIDTKGENVWKYLFTIDTPLFVHSVDIGNQRLQIALNVTQHLERKKNQIQCFNKNEIEYFCFFFSTDKAVILFSAACPVSS